MSELLRQKVVSDLLISEILVIVVPGADTGPGSVRQRSQGVTVAPVHLLGGGLVALRLLLIQGDPADSGARGTGPAPGGSPGPQQISSTDRRARSGALAGATSGAGSGA